MIALLLIIIGLITLSYFFVLKNLNYWVDKRVPTGNNSIFDALWLFLGIENFASLIHRTYNQLENVRYLGGYQLGMPVSFLKSPELIKQICVKNFDHFVDHRNMIPEGVDEFWSRNLFFLRGQTWKNMRSAVSPTFTSKKMKSMFVLMCENAEILVQYFLNKNQDIVEIEAKDVFTRYTNDIIGNVVFGIQINSLEDRENEFYTIGKEAVNFNSIWVTLKIFLFQFLPSIGTFLGIQFFQSRLRDFFLNLVKEQIKIREEKNINRVDMLGLLLETRKGKEEQNEEEIKDNSFAAVEEHLEVKSVKRNLTDLDITAQLFLFFVGGFESSSSTMCLMAQELLENQDVQKKLIDEIDEHATDGPPSYDTISRMTYLDMVISETLRKWPINVATDRVVTKPYTIQPELPGEHPVHLNNRDNIMVPIYGLHHDPQYFPVPEKFDPERFSPENRKSIDPYTYLPFGVGPRNCVGSRFVLLEIKALIFYILRNFEIVAIETSQIPIKMKKNSFNYAAEKGYNFGLKKRFH